MTRLLLDKTKQTEEVDYRPISHNNCRTPSNFVDLSISFFDTATEAQSVIASYFLVHQKGTHQHQLSWHEERIAAVTLKHPPSLFLRTAHVHVVTATAFPAYLSLPPSDTRIRRTYKMPSTFIGRSFQLKLRCSSSAILSSYAYENLSISILRKSRSRILVRM